MCKPIRDKVIKFKQVAESLGITQYVTENTSVSHWSLDIQSHSDIIWTHEHDLYEGSQM